MNNEIAAKFAAILADVNNGLDAAEAFESQFGIGSWAKFAGQLHDQFNGIG